MMSGSIAELARRESSACDGVRQSRVSKAPQFSQTGPQVTLTWLHLVHQSGDTGRQAQGNPYC